MYFTQLIGRNGKHVNKIVNHGTIYARCQIPDGRLIFCLFKKKYGNKVACNIKIDVKYLKF